MVEVDNKMNLSVSHFKKELNSLRTSRANPAMLDNIIVDAYGTQTPINQLGNISVQDASTITIQIWDTSLIKSIETAITLSIELMNSLVGTTKICLFSFGITFL